MSNASQCETRFGGYFLNGRCYYHVRESCSVDEYYQQCTCYPHRSSTYSNDTCYNIDGYYTADYCYYVGFNCSGYATNDQCYLMVWLIVRVYNDGHFAFLSLLFLSFLFFRFLLPFRFLHFTLFPLCPRGGGEFCSGQSAVLTFSSCA